VSSQKQEYAGFWIRVGASLIDTILILIIVLPILTAIYGKSHWLSESFVKGFWDVFFSYLLPAIAVIIFWTYKSATPGKMATNLTIVDAKTGGRPSIRQFVIRYLGYYVAGLPLFLGIIWVGIDKRKQGWHDKLAGTVVIRNPGTAPVEFERQTPNTLAYPPPPSLPVHKP
jgi:uncharacterized RDD family membrane protein YckC